MPVGVNGQGGEVDTSESPSPADFVQPSHSCNLLEKESAITPCPGSGRPPPRAGTPPDEQRMTPHSFATPGTVLVSTSDISQEPRSSQDRLAKRVSPACLTCLSPR